MLKITHCIAFLFILLSFAAPANAQIERELSTLEKLYRINSLKYGNIEIRSERLASSDARTVILDDKTWTYRFHVNTTHLADPGDGLPPADMVSFSYETSGDHADKMRPVLFAYNGGPGSTSVWLHMGAWGPKRINMPGGPEIQEQPPYHTVDNQGFLIDVADLVFVDPINTGLSKPADASDMKAFKDLGPDAKSHCLFIHNWLKANDRFGAPIYLAGESYGTMRIAMMETHSACRALDLNFDGLIFVSGLIDMEARRNASQRGTHGFPTAAALAWYHQTVDRGRWKNDMESYLDAARDFATTQFGPTLMLGDYASDDIKTELAKEKAAFLGQSNTDKTKLANIWSFPMGPLCMYDGRYTCNRDGKNNPISAFPPMEMDELGRVFTASLRDWAKDAAGFDIGRQYTWRAKKAAYSGWKMTLPSPRGDVSYATLPKTLAYNQQRQLAEIERHLAAQTEDASDSTPPPRRTRIMVASGLHDIVTPFFGIEFPLKREGAIIDALHLYEGGHMMYFDEKIGRQLADDVRSFVENSGD